MVSCAGTAGTDSGSMSDAPLADILTAHGLLEHLPILSRSGVDTKELVALHAEGRPKLLARLKDTGLDRLPVRQAVANAVGKYLREGVAVANNEAQGSDGMLPSERPAGSMLINLRCVGTLGGENCPGNGKLRQTTVYTLSPNVLGLYDELTRVRGYTQGYVNVRVSVSGKMLDAAEAAERKLEDGMSINFIGPNNGG